MLNRHLCEFFSPVDNAYSARPTRSSEFRLQNVWSWRRWSTVAADSVRALPAILQRCTGWETHAAGPPAGGPTTSPAILVYVSPATAFLALHCPTAQQQTAVLRCSAGRFQNPAAAPVAAALTMHPPALAYQV